MAMNDINKPPVDPPPLVSEPYFVILNEGLASTIDDFSFAVVVESSPGAAIELVASNLRDGLHVVGYVGLKELKSHVSLMEAMKGSPRDIWFQNEDYKSPECPY